MKQNPESLTECARLTAIGVTPIDAAAMLDVSLRTVTRWMALPEVQALILVRGERWRRDERRRRNGERRSWLRSAEGQATGQERKRTERAVAAQTLCAGIASIDRALKDIERQQCAHKRQEGRPQTVGVDAATMERIRAERARAERLQELMKKHGITELNAQPEPHKT